MAIKLLHTGDLHLDAPFTFLGEKGQQQRQELLTTLNKIVELAIEEKVDLFLIAGDLFDSNNPSYTTIDRAVEIFKKLEQSDIPICLIPGSHDSYNAHSIYRLYNFKDALSNLTIFTDIISQKIFEHLELTVYGKAVLGKGGRGSSLQNLAPTTKTKFHVGLVHGIIHGLQEETTEREIFYADQIERSKMNYIALGHHHSFANYSQDSVKAFYCGSPDMLDLEQNNYGHVAIVTIQPSGEINIKPKRVGRCYFKSEKIAVDSVTDLSQIESIIKNKAHPNIFLEARLTGLCSFDLLIDTEAIEQELEHCFLKLRVVDETHPQLEEIPVGELPENTVLGRFISLMRNELDKSTGEERELNEKVLKLGVSLLRGKRVIDDY